MRFNTNHKEFLLKSHLQPFDQENMITIGHVRRAVGLTGRVEVELFSGEITRLKPGTSVLVGGHRLDVEKITSGRKGLFSVHFEGIGDRDSADELRGAQIEVPETELPPPSDGTYYHYQLIDSSVRDTNGVEIGKLSGIMETGANDVYVVSTVQGGEILIPATRSMIKFVDTVNGVIVVDLPDGEVLSDEGSS